MTAAGTPKRSLAIFAALAALAFPAHGQQKSPDGYPARPVRILTGAPVGTGSDILIRIVAQQLGERWGKSALVDNRTGAVGSIALDLAARAAPDGYPLMICSTQNFTAMLLGTVAIDIPKALAPIALLGETPYMLITTPALPVASVKELRDLAKSKPLIYASSGTGSAVHLAMELFKSMAGLDLMHVPYKGSSQSLIDIMSGRVHVAMTNTLTATPLVKAGKIKALAITSARRSANFPELPTISEAGVKGYQSSTWYGLFAPIKTPPAIIAWLNGEVGQVMAKPDLRARLTESGVEPPAASSPPEIRKMIARELDTWGKVIKSAGIKAE